MSSKIMCSTCNNAGEYKEFSTFNYWYCKTCKVELKDDSWNGPSWVNKDANDEIARELNKIPLTLKHPTIDELEKEFEDLIKNGNIDFTTFNIKVLNSYKIVSKDLSLCDTKTWDRYFNLCAKIENERIKDQMRHPLKQLLHKQQKI